MDSDAFTSAENRRFSRIGKNWWAFLTTVWNEFMRTRLTLIAAGVAFYGLLALFPGIGAIMAIGGLLSDEQTVASTMDSLSDVLPDAAAEIITSQASAVATSSTDGLGVMAIVGILITIYSASKGMQALIDGMNIIYGFEESRSLVMAYVMRMALTFGLIIGFLICIGVAVAIPIVLAWIPMTDQAAWIVSGARWPILLLIGAGGLAATYRIGPSERETPWRWLVPGAAIACILWILGTVAFALYVQYFATYQETFGALGGVVILLMWLWLSATIVLFGALVAKTLARRSDDPEDKSFRA